MKRFFIWLAVGLLGLLVFVVLTPSYMVSKAPTLDTGMPAPTAPAPPAAEPPRNVPMAPSSTTILKDGAPVRQRGNIAFNAPDEMPFNATQPVQLILDPVRSMEDVKAMVKEQGPVIGAEIDIAPRMQASLKGDGFNITAITPDVQAVLPNEPTEWRWSVTPTVKENTTLDLYLTVNMIIKVEGVDVSRVAESYRHQIRIRITPEEKAKSFWDSEWKWLLGTIFLPLLAWWYKLHSGKKTDTGETPNKT